MLEEKKEIISEFNQIEFAKKIILAESIELGADILEVGLDQILEEGVLKDIPIFGEIIKVGNTIKTVHDAFFTKKVITFAQSIHNKNSSEEKWKQHKEKLMNNPKRLIKEVEVLLIYIERHTKYIKSKVLGNLYTLYYMEKIDWDDFEEFAEILDSISVFDFETLEELFIKKYYFEKEKYNSLALKRLSNCGLVDFFNGMVVTENGKVDAVSYVAKITGLGEYFWEFGINGVNTKDVV